MADSTALTRISCPPCESNPAYQAWRRLATLSNSGWNSDRDGFRKERSKPRYLHGKAAILQCRLSVMSWICWSSHRIGEKELLVRFVRRLEASPKSCNISLMANRSSLTGEKNRTAPSALGEQHNWFIPELYWFQNSFLFPEHLTNQFIASCHKLW